MAKGDLAHRERKRDSGVLAPDKGSVCSGYGNEERMRGGGGIMMESGRVRRTMLEACHFIRVCTYLAREGNHDDGRE